MKNNIIEKIKKANLVGRGGGCFPVATKWQMVKSAPSKTKYVVCNCSEGEPGVDKDGYLVEKYTDRVIDGMKLAMDFLILDEVETRPDVKGIFYISPVYYKKYKKLLEAEIKKAGAKIEIFAKPHSAGYIGGEEMSALNVIEGKKAEPRMRPPYPTTSGLWGHPTLVNNVETFYNVSLADKDQYKKTRFCTITGDCLFEGVYEFPEDYPMDKILKETHNYPKFDFFVQVGGGGSGMVLNSKQLKQPVFGAGSIHIYSMKKYEPQKLMLSWVKFFCGESCGQCTPCREGTYRLKEILENQKPDWNTVADILTVLSDTAFCGLGFSVPNPIISYIKNVLNNYPERKVNLPIGSKKIICSCFK